VAYEIFRKEKDSTGTFLKIAEVRKEFERLDTTFIDTAIVINRLYYYYVQARDEIGQEGPPSEKVGYLIVPWPDLVTPIKQGTYVNIFTKLITLIADYSPNQEWSAQKLAAYGLQLPLPTGRYRWRIDVIGTGDNEGSESNWETFRVQ